MLKQLFIIFILFTLGLHVEAQVRYVVRFTDKNNTPFSINSPGNFLSQRAIDRRKTNHVTIDDSDLPVDPVYVQQISSVTGVKVLNHSKWFNSVTVEIDTPATLSLNTINALSFVKSAAKVGRVEIPGASTIEKFDGNDEGPLNNTFLSSQRLTGINYGNAMNQATMINIDALHDLGYSGKGIIIAVLDVGFSNANLMSCFDSLFNQGRVLATWDFVNNEANVYDNGWHGASVLSTMAANIPGVMVGTAPDAQYILLRSEDDKSEHIIEEYNWASAAEFADSAGADVINSSLGYTTFDDPAEDHTYADMDGNTCPGTIAADMAVSKGIIVVNSAGNSGNSSWHYIVCPSDGNLVLAIGAVNSSGIYASFSSQGPSSDGRVKPDIVSQGRNSTVFIPGNSSSSQSSGTSFSSPIIAGSVACLRQHFPAKTNIEIIQAVKQSASQYSSPDVYLGYGIPDFGLASLILEGYNLSDFNNELELLDFYPNPVMHGASLNLNFYSRLREMVKMEVMDASGKILDQQSLDASSTIKSFDLNSKISAGIYFIRASTTNRSIVRKLVVY